MPAPPIVLVHGLWLTPRSWDGWKERFEARGHRVLAPAWPRMQGEVEDVRRDPSSMNGLGVTEIVDHYDGIIRGLDSPPVIMGHSFGGLVTVLLLDRGLGAASPSLLRRSRACCACRRPSCARPSRCSATRPTGTERSS
jgi:pimeloyl-ACP methyl ester carboxylesterase